jgi:PAS domain S-box-containing protein
MVGDAGDVRAVMAVYRPEALTPSERSLLEALASQVRVRLVNQRLFAETVEQRTQLADIIAHTSDGIFALSPDGLILSWNPAMEHITGWSTRRAVGRSWEDVLGPRHQTDGSSDAGPAADNVLLVREDGAERWIRYTRTPVEDRAGTLTAEVVVVRDVTADMEAEQLKADFVATVSHELRSPLTPLRGFLSTLMSGTGEDSPEARSEFYRIMDKQVHRLERLITDLLEVSRIEAAQVPVDARSVDLTALVAEHLDEVRRDQPHRAVQLRGPGQAVHVHADPFRVAQVVANLLSNALKYSLPETPVEVTVASVGEQAIVSVRDEGEGIPLSEQDRVFDRFHRVESGLTRKTGGTGLGLYIAKRLVEAMGGRLWLVSSPGHGSTFSFSLPAVPAPERLERVRTSVSVSGPTPVG